MTGAMSIPAIVAAAEEVPLPDDGAQGEGGEAEAGDDPGPAALPPDGQDMDWDLLRRCCAEDPNDVGNARRLMHRHGEDIIHVQNLGFYVWEGGRRWAEDVDGRVSRPMCHRVVDAIRHEHWVITGTEEELAAIAEADAAMTPLKAARDGLAGAADDAKAGLRAEIERLQATVAEGQAAKAAISKRRTARRKFALGCGNSGRIGNMLTEVLPYVSRKIEELDRDPLALNLQNGTLRFVSATERNPDYDNPDVSAEVPETITRWSARLDAHARGDMNSKMAEADYRPSAPCPTFTGFIETILPSAEVRGFVQRYLGYALTGLTREQVFCIWYGEGANGKSTLIDVVARILADYSTSLPIATFVNDNRAGKGSEATPDLARIPGARLVRTAEPKEGLSLDESLIKGLTSNEPMPIRRLNKEFIDVYPNFKLVLACNRKPTIKGNDDGIWRRVRMVPFTVQIPEAKQDKGLIDKLWAERDGILAWLVEGCLAYLDHGLGAPVEVTDATREYREESDVIGGFVRVALEVTREPADEVGSGALYAAFLRYTQITASPVLAAATFNRRMPKAATQFGFVKSKASSSVYQGIRVRDAFKPESGPSRRATHGDDAF